MRKGAVGSRQKEQRRWATTGLGDCSFRTGAVTGFRWVASLLRRHCDHPLTDRVATKAMARWALVAHYGSARVSPKYPCRYGFTAENGGADWPSASARGLKGSRPSNSCSRRELTVARPNGVTVTARMH